MCAVCAVTAHKFIAVRSSPSTFVSRRYLFVAFMVASSVLIRRYHQAGITKSAPTVIRWALITLFSIGAATASDPA